MDKARPTKGGRSSRRGGGGSKGRGTKVTSTGARSSGGGGASKKRTRLVLEVARLEDYRAVAELLQAGAGAGGVALDADVFGVLIGCSGHSPVPAHLVDKVAGVLHREVVLPRGVSAIWGGGDPCFRFRARGGNVADIARILLRLHQGHVATSSASAADARPAGLLIGAVQRDDYASKVPAFEEVVVAYHASLAQVGGRPTFGGFETAAVPPAYREFLASLRREVTQEEEEEEEEEEARQKRQRTVASGAKELKEDPAAAEALTTNITTTTTAIATTTTTTSKKRLPISGQFLPPEGIYPMAASAGYLSLLPALLGARELVLMVVPTAGTITLQEVTYTQLLLEHLAKQQQQGGEAVAPPVHIYAVTWPDMEAHLTPGEKNGRCKLLAIMALLRSLHARFPANVHFLDIMA